MDLALGIKLSNSGWSPLERLATAALAKSSVCSMTEFHVAMYDKLSLTLWSRACLGTLARRRTKVTRRGHLRS